MTKYCIVMLNFLLCRILKKLVTDSVASMVNRPIRGYVTVNITSTRKIIENNVTLIKAYLHKYLSIFRTMIIAGSCNFTHAYSVCVILMPKAIRSGGW